MNILNEIVESTKLRVDERKKELPLDRLINMIDFDETAEVVGVDKAAKVAGVDKAAEVVGVDKTAEVAKLAASKKFGKFPFEQALKLDDEIAFICEVKKASPSKGIIAEDFRYIETALEYETAGAAAISVLTEPKFFQGDDRYLREIADAASIPLLRKDFVVDEYMIYEAKMMGADAVLLICAILCQERLSAFINTAHSIGLSALVETHDERELMMALAAGARIIGANNRDLNTFEVDIKTSIKLRKLAPDNIIFVSESGIQTAEDVQMLRYYGVDAVLIGETLMRAPDKKAALTALKRRGGCPQPPALPTHRRTCIT